MNDSSKKTNTYKKVCKTTDSKFTSIKLHVYTCKIMHKSAGKFNSTVEKFLIYIYLLIKYPKSLSYIQHLLNRKNISIELRINNKITPKI